ncbi:MAG: response regulator [Lachnospiraceae bacterium]|nr:response regulator [Lachnospiraceae bacterium]
MKKTKYIPVIVIALLLVVTIVADAVMVFKVTSSQTLEKGKYQLESISGQLEITINEAKNFTMQLALAAQSKLDDKEELEKFIFNHRAHLADYGNGAYNVYIAGPGWDIIPDLVKTDDYVTTERGWYTGAIKNDGVAYVTPPYVDAATGNICYTVAIMLPDGETVFGVDYTMENIQAHVTKMSETDMHNTIIVTLDGIIAGAYDENLIGEELKYALPEYSAVFNLAKNADEFVTYRLKSGRSYENLFAAGSSTGWYLIVSINDWELYREAYIQLILTTLLMICLMIITIMLYVMTAKSKRKAEEALKNRNELLTRVLSDIDAPIRKIISDSDPKNITETESADEKLAQIHVSGQELSHAIRQIISYSKIVETEEKAGHVMRESDEKTLQTNKRFRNIILALLLLIMTVGVFTTAMFGIRLANSTMKSEVNSYEAHLSEWIYKQKSILDTFVGIIASNSEMLDDYEGCISFLDGIAQKYPEISVVYMTNPKLEHTVYMNNGWEPDENWKVEERQWYIDTLNSKTGWSVSAPYYDEQTGIYCVTISERVYDDETGEFIGNFGIDFYMDKLIRILSDSYSEEGYAFLADGKGDIINHPYGMYQMSVNDATNVSELRYGELLADGKSTMIIKDYDGVSRVVIAKRSDISGFTVYKANGVWNVYGNSFLLGLLYAVVIITSVVIVYVLLTRLIRWQDSVNRRMKEAADEATAAGQAKSQFLAQMSHEIRTPINAVLGMNEMILYEAEDNNILDYSKNIQTAGKTLLTLVNSILDFSKIEDGKMKIVPVRYDTVSFLNNLTNSVSQRAKDKGLEFKLEADKNLPSMLIGDDVRLSQVVMNLLTNAVKYTEKGSVILKVMVKEIDGGEAVLFFSVKDTGIGIREEDRDKLFESFSRLDETRNRNIEGTGLGMAIVTKLLGLMDSSLQVESTYGEGSEFSFEIIQGVADDKPVGENLERRVQPENRKKQNKNFAGASILVTDDNEMNRKVAANLLKLLGVKADLASSGEETLELLKKKHFDIILLDHMMPKMDGIETLKNIRELGIAGDKCVIIALTANAVVGAKEFYLDAGFDDYLSKPIELDRLADKLEQYYKPEEKPADDEILEFGADDEVLEFGPDEDVLEFGPGEEATEEGTGTDFIDKLKASGIDTDAGMKFCSEDAEFYRSILEDFAKTDSFEQMRASLDAGDIDKYRIQVHAFKSNSKTIGAMELFELAKSLEMAAKEGDKTFIDENHPKLISMYDEVQKLLKHI